MLHFSRLKTALILGTALLGLLVAVPSLIGRTALEAAAPWFPWRTVTLGLDLRGGSYLMLQVDMDAQIRERLESITDQVRTSLREPRIGYTQLASQGRSVSFRLVEPARRADALAALREVTAPPQAASGFGTQAAEIDLASTEDGRITLTLTEAALRAKATRAVEQSIEIVRRRIDESGVVEPTIARQGADRILVQLPGIQDPERIKSLLGKTAKMTFHLLDEGANPNAGLPPPGVMFLSGETRAGQAPGTEGRYAVRRRVEVDGASLRDARASLNNQSAEWVVNFEFDGAGSRRFADITRANVGRPFAIVLDDKVLTAPVIREPITGGRGQISGSFDAASANDLAVLLRAGALPAPLTVVEERSVGPELGADAIRSGLIAVGVGFVLTLAYMIAVYGLFGVFACLGLFVNLVLTLAVLALLEATLTLPGIAGLLLTLGMSVDANILINERIREEQRRGRSPIAAMEAGFTRAFSTITDSNLTALIAMILLYAFGSGPVRGFAVTVSFGIITSLFSAVSFVRLLIVLWYRRNRPSTLPV